MKEHDPKIIAAPNPVLPPGTLTTYQTTALGPVQTGFYTDSYVLYDPSFNAREEYLADDDESPKSRNPKPCSHYTVGRSKTGGVTYWTHDPTTCNQVGHTFGCASYPHRATLGWPTAKFGSIWEPYGSASLVGTLYPVSSLYTASPTGFKYVNDPEDLDILISDAVKACFPKIRKDLQNLNSILELRDFKGLSRRVASVASKVRQVQRWCNTHRADLSMLRRKKATLRRLLRAGSDWHLFNAFAVQPLLSDIQAVYRSVQTLRKQLDKLLKEAGGAQTRHFTADLSDKYPSTDAVIPVSFSPIQDGEAWATRSVQVRTAVFHAQFSFTYTLRELELQSAALRARLDSRGISFNPKLIWDAIPWTFVVDWVADIGQWLEDNFSKQMLEPQVTLHEFVWSLKVDRWIHCKICKGPGVHHAADETTTVKIHEVAYKRAAPEYLNLYHPLRTSGLSLSQMLLGASLAFSRKHPGIGGTR